jgi:hypothetical protein
MRYLTFLIWTATVWAAPCEVNLGRLPEVRQALHRLDMLKSLTEAGIGTAGQIQPIKEQLLGFEESLQRDEPLSPEDTRYLDLALEAADKLRLTASSMPPESVLSRGGRADMYDRRFGGKDSEP